MAKRLARNQGLLRVLWVAGVLVVAAGTLLPASSSPMTALSYLDFNDKILHFTAYVMLAFLPALHERRRTVVGILIFLGLLGLALDLAQRLSPGRSTEAADMAANCAGVAIGAALGKAARFRLRTTSAPPAPAA